MTGHQINSLVGDLVAMAQAMERLPQVEHELNAALLGIHNKSQECERIQADLEQSRLYAASLEAKVRETEASRDDAELRFLELDERHAAAIAQSRSLQTALGTIIAYLEPLPQPEPIVSEVKPIAVDPTGVNATENGQQNVNASISSALPYLDNPPQGQSEADPTAMDTPTLSASADTESVANMPSADTTTSWATQTPPKPQPYAGKNYYDWPAYVSYDKWIEGGGTDDGYFELR